MPVNSQLAPPRPATPNKDPLHDPSVVATTGHSPTTKVAGVRHKRALPSNSQPDPKQQRKRKADEVLDMDSSDSDNESETPKPKNTHGGRRQGAGNYQDTDLNELLRLIERHLPIGANGWKRIAASFAQWARRHRRPSRDVKSLESKYKSVC